MSALHFSEEPSSLCWTWLMWHRHVHLFLAHAHHSTEMVSFMGSSSHPDITLSVLTVTHGQHLMVHLPASGLLVMQRDQVYCRSTNYQRTLATLQGVLTGMYPNERDPIPVETAQDIDEVLFANMGSCERLRQLLVKARLRVKGKLFSFSHRHTAWCQIRYPVQCLLGMSV